MLRAEAAAVLESARAEAAQLVASANAEVDAVRLSASTELRACLLDVQQRRAGARRALDAAAGDYQALQAALDALDGLTEVLDLSEPAASPAPEAETTTSDRSTLALNRF